MDELPDNSVNLLITSPHYNVGKEYDNDLTLDEYAKLLENVFSECFMRGEIIWDKSASAGGSCAWGSWMSASNPVLRDVHEYILVFCKDSFSKKKVEKKGDTIGRDDFFNGP